MAKLVIPSSRVIGSETIDDNAKRRVVSSHALRHAAEAINEREEKGYQGSELAKQDFARDERKEVKYDQSQLNALDMIIDEQYACIIGSAGTGKTTIMAGALPRLRDMVPLINWGAARSAGTEPGSESRPAIALCTFTNVAAMNLASKLPEEWTTHCMSIHSMLAYAPVDYAESEGVDASGKSRTMFEPRYHASNPMPYKIVIFDEMGIVSRDLWHNVLDAVQPDTKIIFLGDIAQLPALQGVSPMPFAMRKWPTAVLDKIYRQAGDSSIIPNLTRIRKGVHPVHAPQDFRCDKAEILPEHTLKAREQIAKYIGVLHRSNLWDPKQDIILTPQNETALGQKYWNGAFRYTFNPLVDPNGNRVSKAAGNAGQEVNPPILIQTALQPIMLQVGDKIMATDNGGRRSTEIRFNNGSIGIVTAIWPNPEYKGVITDSGAIDVVDKSAQDIWNMVSEMGDELDTSDDTIQEIMAEDDDVKRRQASHIVVVKELSTGATYQLSRSAEISTLNHAYAATCHKFQGSQARHVMVICHRSMPFGLNREWLYTACSRAKARVFLMADQGSLTKALLSAQIQGRTAEEKAEALERIYMTQKSWAIPDLPEPRKW